MKINIKATGIELTPAISDYVSKKVSMLEKYLEQGADVVAHVEVGKTSNHHKSGEVFRAEVHLMGAGLDLYTVSEQVDLYAAIDMVKDEAVQNLTNKKGRTRALARRGAQVVKNMMKGLNFFKRNEG
jgi:ribosomal subunit interface protein